VRFGSSRRAIRYITAFGGGSAAIPLASWRLKHAPFILFILHSTYNHFFTRSTSLSIMAANDFHLEGKLLVKGETTQVSASFSKRELVLEVPGQYTQYVKFELKQAKCAELDKYNVGDQLKVHFNIDGREWQGKYFTNLSAWRIERVSATAQGGSNGGGGSYSTPLPTAQDEPKYNTNTVSTNDDGGDDLPF
jgi:single-strand DNA-binding protein